MWQKLKPEKPNITTKVILKPNVTTVIETNSKVTMIDIGTNNQMGII
jgi:hypothetical protein